MRIVALGDSITEGYPFTNQESWVKYLAQELQCPVLNQGICGDSTSGMRERFRRDVLAYTPTHVIILGGANDACERIHLKRVSANFIAIVELCKQHGIIPIFGLPTPSLFIEEEQFLSEYRNWLKGYADALNIMVVDFHSPFLDRIGAGQGPQLFVDGIHPSIEGYTLMGEAAAQCLKSLRKPPGSIPFRLQPERQIVITTAVPAERDAVLRGLRHDPRFDVLVVGVGSVVAAVNTARALMTGDYSLVISAGIAGGFPGRAEVGSLVVANEIVVADLGAENPKGFRSLAELGYGFTQIQIDAGLTDRLSGALLTAKLPVNTGPVLTVSTVTGSAARAEELASRIPGATAEAMEGYGVGCAALDRALPVLEIRAISNLVGPLERSAWRIKEALEVLEAAGAVLPEVLF